MSVENFYRPDEEVRPEPYPYKACGLDNIFLLNGYEVTEHDGERLVSVRDTDELHKVIGHHVVCERKGLAGRDIRFLRNTMDASQVELAKLLGTTAQTVARWEKGETDIPGPAERLLRMAFLLHFMGLEEREAFMRLAFFERMQELDEQDQVRVPEARLTFDGHWRETSHPCAA